MPTSSNWRRLIDDRILQHPASEAEPLTAWMIGVDLQYPTGLVRARCRQLAHADFVARRDRECMDAEYEITTWGIQYLSGDVDANLRRPYPRTRPPEAVRPGWYAGFG